MGDTVYLEDLRCDGSGHGGCQAGCRIYWKEAWLRRVERDSAEADRAATTQLQEQAELGTRTVREGEGERAEVWRCQATEALGASKALKTSDVRQYWRELRSGNFGLGHFLRVAVRGFFLEVAIRIRPTRWVPLRGPGGQPSPSSPDLQPGDLVQVRSPAEIAVTLDADGRNRGLSFDHEMLPYCGGTYRVKESVKRIIDERTGRMIHIARDCLILEGVVCSGERSVGRLFCPRKIYPYWREAWLRRLDEPTQSAQRPPTP
jgi:hypothetical protein